MRTKNELYQEALRTVAARRQIARARAEDARAEAEAAVPALRHAEESTGARDPLRIGWRCGEGSRRGCGSSGRCPAKADGTAGFQRTPGGRTGTTVHL